MHIFSSIFWYSQSIFLSACAVAVAARCPWQQVVNIRCHLQIDPLHLYYR